jgi:poly-gamma-glutamate capsule biosynthesis protein CapA/YwtB (metallophosphatase superfamily)
MTFHPLSVSRKVAYGAALVVALTCSGFVITHGSRQVASAKAPRPATYPHELSRITFAAAGDVIPHQAVVQAAAAAAQSQPANAAASTPDNHSGWDVLFASVADVFRQADFGFVNLETPIAPLHSRGSKPFQFDAPIALLQSLKFSGIKIVSFANNHVFDQNRAGFAESLDHLHEQGLLVIGAGATAQDSWKPIILEKNGIKVGWLGMTRWLNGNRNSDKDSDPHVAFFPYPDDSGGAPGLDEPAVLEAIKSARAQCDLLVVSIHWGVEYATAPNPGDVDTAHNLLDAGASLIVGHHPHVLQPVETYLTKDQRHAVVLFSLGNFLSNQSRNYVQGLTPDKAGEQRDSVVVKFSAIKKDYGPAGIRVELGDLGIIPAWTENNHLLVKGGHAKSLSIRPVLLDRVIPDLQSRVDTLQAIGAQLSSQQKQELVQLSNQLLMLKHRRELLLLRTGDDFLIPPPPLSTTPTATP